MTETTDAPAKAELGSLDIHNIMKAIPHRYPFLLVDKIIEIDEDKSCIGIKNVTMNEPQFMGHFPNAPVMPGVLIIEGMAQTAGAICIRSLTEYAGKPAPLVYFMTIDNAKFRKPVGPGDRLEFHITRTNRRRNMWWFNGRAFVDGQLVCEADFSAMLVDKPAA